MPSIFKQNLTPQELQKRYPEYKALMQSMKEVSEELTNFANELYKLVD